MARTLPSATGAVLVPTRLPLDAASVPLCFVSTHDEAADSYKTSGPKASAGASPVSPPALPGGSRGLTYAAVAVNLKSRPRDRGSR